MKFMIKSSKMGKITSRKDLMLNFGNETLNHALAKIYPYKVISSAPLPSISTTRESPLLLNTYIRCNLFMGTSLCFHLVCL